MKMYAFRIYEQGSIIATDTEISKTAIIKRSRGQRYQIPSLLRAVQKNNLDHEVIDAISALMGDIADKIKKDGFAVIDWAAKTDTKVMINLEDGTWLESTRKWADYDDKELNKAILPFMPVADEEDDDQKVGKG